MKKILLLALVILGGVLSANADIYLYSNLNSTSENNNLDWYYTREGYTFTWIETNSNYEDVYTYTINASNYSDDIMFRLYIDSWDCQLRPSQSQFTLDLSNTNNVGYTIWSYNDNSYRWKDSSWGDLYFKISHKDIKASEYKITLYQKQDGHGENGKIYMDVAIVSMPATISALGFATFSCDRALDLSGVNAYYASGVTNGKVVLTKTTGKVPAATGLLLAGSGDITIPVVATSEATALDGNLLKASVTETSVAASTEGAYHYFLAGSDASSLGFYNIATTTNSAAGKAYLETTTALASEASPTGTARAAWIFESETQSINNVESTKNVDMIYDLQGRVANTSKAGLYIKNGKKVFVK